MKLYYSPFSPNARKVRIAAHLLGTDLELINVDLGKGEQRQPPYLSKNAMGKVPLLEDGDLRLPESGAIMIYLADGTELYPADRRARAEVNRWLFWTGSHWGPAVAALNFENFLKKFFGGGDPDPVQVKRQEDFIRQFGKVLDDHLANREWVAGKKLTIADIAIAPSLAFTAIARLPVQSFANIEAWYQRMQALDAWKATEPPRIP
jgi:glutathione S-transferase